MTEKVTLDPRKISGIIDINTPYFIIEYIAKICKIAYNSAHIKNDSFRGEIIKLINEHEYPEIDKPTNDSDEHDLKKLLRFISPFLTNDEWFSDSVVHGYEHLISFDESFNEIPYISKESVSFGWKTNSSPLALNELIVYRISKFNKYPLDKTTSLNELNLFVEKFISKKISNFKQSLLYTINSLSDVDLLKIYYTTSNLASIVDRDEEFKFLDKKEHKYDFEQPYLDICMNTMFDSKKIISRIRPKTKYEAIVYAAVKHNVNIIQSSDPLKEIDCLKHGKYIPYCTSFAKKFFINSKYYSINRRWCEELSDTNIYSIEQLRNFTLEEGFDKINTLSFGELNSYLKSTKISLNVYFGRHPECKDVRSCISLTSIDEIPDRELFCFGIEKTNQLNYISLDDLIDFFENMKMYIDPVKFIPLDERVIKKIRLYCSNVSSDLVKKTRKLIEIMNELDKIKKLIDVKVKDLKIKLRNTDQETRDNVDFFFRKCMEMGLYMRGWKINPAVEYPLLSQDAQINENDEIEPDKDLDISIYGEDFKYTVKQKIIDCSVKSLDESVEILNELPLEIRNDIKCLQTVKFTDNGMPVEIMGNIIKGAYTYQNETLIDSMRKIYNGMGPADSCIRTNSTWILFSSCWYRLLFGFDVPFRIDKIQPIR